MSEAQHIEFNVVGVGQRLDKLVLARLPQLSRAQVQALIKAGEVTVDGVHVKAGVKLKGGEVVRITLPPEDDEDSLEPEEMALNVLYEDAHIVVINKPAGLVVHPGSGNATGTLVNGLLARYPQMMQMQGDDDAEGRLGIVHRLDKDTSGVMVAALHVDALQGLMAQFQDRTVEKVYIALVERAPKTPTGLIDAPIGRDPKQRKRMSVQAAGRPAVTAFEIIEDQLREERALLRLVPKTGRTHQLRVHLAFINCPIVGDRVYGYRKQRTSLKRHFLHAADLSFDHPMTGERLTFSTPLPVGLQNLLEKLRLS